MSRLVWESLNPYYFSGVDRGVLYPPGAIGVAWSGLVGVQETPEVGETVTAYYDGYNYVVRQKPSIFACSIQALSSPAEFDSFEGFDELPRGIVRPTFGFSYRVRLSEEDYQIHLVYGATAKPTSKSFKALAPTIAPSTFSWDIATAPVDMGAGLYGSHIVLDTRQAHPWTIAAVEALLYGEADSTPYLPNPADLLAVFEANAILKVTDHGDGTWTAEGPDEAFTIVGDYFEIEWPSVRYISTDTFQISSL